MGIIKTPLGRIIWGHPMRSQIKKDDNDVPILKDGQPVNVWSFGLAIPKADFVPVWADMAAEAAKLYGGGAVPQNFAWKYKDGDTALDKNNKPLREKEGYAGHFILTISTEYKASECYKWENNAWQQLQESQIKTGDYCAVGLNIVPHPAVGRGRPGLYLNPTAVELVYYGTAISSGVDPLTALGAGPGQYAMPQGASAAPVGAPAGAPAMPGAMPQMPGAAPGGMPMSGQQPGMPQYAPPPVQQQPQPGYPQQPAAPGQPAYDYVQQVTGQPYPPQTAQMPMPGQQPGMPQYAPPPVQQQPQPGYPQQQPMPGAPPAMPGMPGQMPGMGNH